MKQSLKQFTLPIKKMEKSMRKAMPHVPKVMANTGLNFALDNMKKQSWQGAVTQPWKARKNPTVWGEVKRPGRTLLVDSGRGRRSGRIKNISHSGATLEWPLPYMKAHNEGINGIGVIQSVKPFTRTVKGVEQSVSAHTRRIVQRLPKRKFIGNSPYLNALIQREVSKYLLRELRR